MLSEHSGSDRIVICKKSERLCSASWESVFVCALRNYFYWKFWVMIRKGIFGGNSEVCSGEVTMK